SIFSSNIQRRTLPIVVFPGLTVAHIRQGSAQGGWIASALRVVAGIGGDSERTIEIRIPSAETYSVPSLLAVGVLEDFCEDVRTNTMCTEDGARRQLSMVVGSKIFEKVDDKQQQGEKQFRFKVEINLVSGVYLTRSIETVVRSKTNLRGDAKLST